MNVTQPVYLFFSLSSPSTLPTPRKLRYTSVPQPHKLCTAMPPPKYSAYALPSGNPYPSPARLCAPSPPGPDMAFSASIPVCELCEPDKVEDAWSSLNVVKL
ncbi:hypothetical protein HBH98_125820 [Parastagonospora nodorum]|nr:hypothetical protein HBH53_119890 [Parastagonospora nodorum]KAH3970614.1 hypothetical protein HBH51_116280 [Parastagonospora nodorum]KAH3996539.1 hypothetical protein HBI10_157680 [Parastagonospora nodorum]KAH4196215.1 hypothetical protein HBI95_189430 [Parastagonospora nodorum]KAH4345249.1 hypothetical protein HBH98_125820 [Parastagonospora nodorum]